MTTSYDYNLVILGPKQLQYYFTTYFLASFQNMPIPSQSLLRPQGEQPMTAVL